MNRLSKDIKTTIKQFIKDKSVIDLGAGNLSLAKQLLALEAKSILAIDKEVMPKIEDIEIKQCDFSEVTESRDVAFLSMPINRFCEGLNEILARHKTVIYLGSNIEGVASGSLALFDYLRNREPLAHICEPQRTLIVYGDHERKQPLYAEEYAAIDSWLGGPIMNFEDAVSYNSKIS